MDMITLFRTMKNSRESWAIGWNKQRARPRQKVVLEILAKPGSGLVWGHACVFHMTRLVVGLEWRIQIFPNTVQATKDSIKFTSSAIRLGCCCSGKIPIGICRHNNTLCKLLWYFLAEWYFESGNYPVWTDFQVAIRPLEWENVHHYHTTIHRWY